MDIFFYSLYNIEGQEIFDSQYKSLQEMKNLGLKTNKNYKKIQNKQELFEYIEFWSNNSRANLDYGTDGIVIKIDDVKIQKNLEAPEGFPNGLLLTNFQLKLLKPKL